MSSTEEEIRPLNLKRPKRTLENFAEFIRNERERMLNSGDDFDEEMFNEAVELVLRRLQTYEEEGLA
jgi:hypothetical protein